MPKFNSLTILNQQTEYILKRKKFVLKLHSLLYIYTKSDENPLNNMPACEITHRKLNKDILLVFGN